MTRRTCVVDGDTFWLEGEKIRIADIDTPEISEPKCDAEYQLGMKATHRLRDLLNEGAFEFRPIGNRDEDRFGRKLREIGRASCRERVCQYVAFTVVAVSLKKKK